MEPLVTICARRGSKGLPGKNTKLMHNKPLCEWTMIQAKEWALEHGDCVIAVSSDDPEVKKIALKHNLWFIKRPAEFCTDRAGKVEAIRHCWQRMERETHKVFDIVLDLDVCNPMRRVQDIEAVYQTMFCSAPTPLTVFSVTPARRNPYFNMYPPVMGNSITRRQDSPAMYDLNCNIYGYSREFMLSNRQHPITSRSEIYVMPDWSFCDIDSELDFSIVRFLMEEYAEELGKAPY